MLRALGATRSYIARSLLLEASILALCGAAIGISLAVLAIYLFRRAIVASLGVPFLLPAPGSLVLQIGVGLLLATASVFVAALLPAIKDIQLGKLDAGQRAEAGHSHTKSSGITVAIYYL